MNLHDSATKALRMLNEAKAVAIDSETTGVNWLKACPIGWAIATDDEAVYVPIRHGGGGNLPDPAGRHVMESASGAYYPHTFEQEVARILARRPGLLLIGHHMKFDYHMARNVGIEFSGNKITCTMNNEALLDEYATSYSLDALSKEYKVETKKSEDMYRHLSRLFGVPANRESMSHFWRTSGTDPVVTEYAETDALATIQILKKQTPKMLEDNLQRVWAMENELIHVLVNMERRGIHVDMDYLEGLPGLIEEKVAEAREALPAGFNERSPKQVREFIEQFRTDWPTTEKGNPSFTKPWLETFPEGRLITGVREWSNLNSSFVTPLRENHVFDGRVHTTFNQNRSEVGGTLSGRLSCYAPNLMGVPKHNKRVGKLYRRSFVPKPGYKLYSGDWSQIEPRTYANHSNCENLVRGYKSDPPIDSHTMAAELMNKDRATTAKRMNMGMFTGMYPKAFAGHMGVPLHEAKELWNQWHRTFPEIRDFQNENKKRIIRDGEIRTTLGRVGRLESHRFAYRATSKLIQGEVADILKYKMIQFERYTPPELELLLTIHDSFEWQAPDTPEGEQASREAVKMLEDIQGEPFNFHVPCVVDLGSGHDWAEASYG